MLVFAASGSVLTSSDVRIEIVARAAVFAVFLVVAWSIVVGRRRVGHPSPAVDG
jgi:hypothetical protein